MAGTARTQKNAMRHPAELLDGEATVDDGDDDAAVSRLVSVIDDEQVAVMDTEPCHRVSLDPDEEGGFVMLDQVLVKAEARFEVVGGRQWKPGRHRASQHRTSRQGNARQRQR